MELLAGITLALFVASSARVTGLDRGKSFYPVVLIVIASYYALFAVMAGSAYIFSLETLAMILFIAASLAGFRGSLWLVVTALIGHGVFDLIHANLIANPWVPKWWPGFCLGYDFVAAACLGWALMRRNDLSLLVYFRGRSKLASFSKLWIPRHSESSHVNARNMERTTRSVVR